MTAAEALVQICRIGLHDFMLNQPAFELSPNDIEAVHQSRIAIRRLRAAMSFFQPIARDWQFDGLREDLKWISDLLGAARDLDVWLTDALPEKIREGQSETGLGEAGRDETGVAMLMKTMEDKRARAQACLNEALHSDRMRYLLFDFAIWLEQGDWRHEPAANERDAQILDFLGQNLLPKIQKVVKRGAQLAKMDPPAQHRFRIRAKKLRYTVELFEDLAVGRRAHKEFERLTGALDVIQTALGRIHDEAALSAYLTSEFCRSPEAGEQPSAAAAFAAGTLARGCGQPKEVLRKAQRAHRDLSDRRPFWAI
jgi:CHAD domain-containing protein